VISLLQSIVATIAQIGALVLYGVVEAINAVTTALAAALNAAAALLPPLPEVPAAPAFVSTMNWLFPVGAIVPLAASLATSYGVFLGVRWVFKKAGVL
jgi:hypothetical protein